MNLKRVRYLESLRQRQSYGPKGRIWLRPPPQVSHASYSVMACCQRQTIAQIIFILSTPEFIPTILFRFWSMTAKKQQTFRTEHTAFWTSFETNEPTLWIQVKNPMNGSELHDRWIEIVSLLCIPWPTQPYSLRKFPRLWEKWIRLVNEDDAINICCHCCRKHSLLYSYWSLNSFLMQFAIVQTIGSTVEASRICQ